MTPKELKKLSRSDLLEMLIDQSTELMMVKEKLKETELALENKTIAINKAGSIAEASLLLNGVFEAAQASCEQYMANLRQQSGRSDEFCRQQEQESLERAQQHLIDTKRRCEIMEADTKIKCAEMISKAKAESKAYWKEVSDKLDAFYAEHEELGKYLSVTNSMNKEQV